MVRHWVADGRTLIQVIWWLLPLHSAALYPTWTLAEAHSCRYLIDLTSAQCLHLVEWLNCSLRMIWWTKWLINRLVLIASKFVEETMSDSIKYQDDHSSFAPTSYIINVYTSTVMKDKSKIMLYMYTSTKNVGVMSLFIYLSFLMKKNYTTVIH